MSYHSINMSVYHKSSNDFKEKKGLRSFNYPKIFLQTGESFLEFPTLWW